MSALAAHEVTAITDANRQSIRGELRTLNIAARRNTLRHKYWSGQAWQLGSAAYWEQFARDIPESHSHRLGATLAEELGACMLGGYGISSEMAEAAFRRLRADGIFESDARPTVPRLEALLREPMRFTGATRRYRFPAQKALRIAGALRRLGERPEAATDQQLRDWLMTLDGVGPKTASWVVRNARHSDSVAVIDIHIVRAGTAAGVFRSDWSVARDYGLFEQAFLQWADQAGIRASHLDARIWAALAYHPDESRDILGVDKLSELPRPVWPL